MIRFVPFAAGILLAFPLSLLIGLAWGIPITDSGKYYLLGSCLFLAGLILFPWFSSKSLLLTAAGAALIVAVACSRVLFSGPNENFQLQVLPGNHGSRWINHLIDEQDAVLLGESLLFRLGGVSQREHMGITHSVAAIYKEMNSTIQGAPSSILSTYLGLQRPRAFDTLVIKPKDNSSTQSAIVFLHGWMGNNNLQCWLMAQAGQEIGAWTICPSVGPQGAWWTPAGEATLRATVEFARLQGLRRIFLAGFSNGGVGVSRMAPGYVEELDGLILISGSLPTPSLKATGLPILLIQGSDDERMPATSARQLANLVGDQGTYAEFEGDHFVMMKQRQAIQKAIAGWLNER